MNRHTIVAAVVLSWLCAACATAGPRNAAIADVPVEQIRFLTSEHEIPPGLSSVGAFAEPAEMVSASDAELLRHFAPQAGRVGANVLVIRRANGRRYVVAYHVAGHLAVGRGVGSDSTRRDESVKGSNGGSTASPGSGGGTVQVRGYRRRDGTYVRPHTRSRPRRRN